MLNCVGWRDKLFCSMFFYFMLKYNWNKHHYCITLDKFLFFQPKIYDSQPLYANTPDDVESCTRSIYEYFQNYHQRLAQIQAMQLERRVWSQPIQAGRAVMVNFLLLSEKLTLTSFIWYYFNSQSDSILKRNIYYFFIYKIVATAYFLN